MRTLSEYGAARFITRDTPPRPRTSHFQTDSAPSLTQQGIAYPRVMRALSPLGLEVALARGVGGLSRRLGRGGGTTIPGKLLATLDPGAIDRLAARLPDGCVVVSATNGKTTSTAMAAEILRPSRRLAHNSAGANLVSGIASSLLAADSAELGLFEIDEFALPELLRRLRPRVLCLSNLFRDQLDR